MIQADPHEDDGGFPADMVRGDTKQIRDQLRKYFRQHPELQSRDARRFFPNPSKPKKK